MNPVLALMETDSFDALANDVANAYFQNPTHVRRLLNEDCVEQCIDYVMSSQTVELDLSDLPENQPLWAKPSRQRKGRKKNTKEVRRKGSAKRFRDRSRHWQAEEHECSVYSRNLCGDGNRRGRRLAKTGEVAFKTSHRVCTDNCAPFIPDPSVDEMDNVTKTFGDVSMTMNWSDWRNYESQWDAFCNSYAFHEFLEKGDSTLWNEYWDKVYEEEEEDLKSGRDLKTNLDKGLDDFDDEIFVNYPDEDEDDDEIIGADCTQEQDTAEFSAVELASIATRIANADPAQRARIRSFMQTV